MKKLTIVEALQINVPTKIEVYAWIDKIRHHKEFIFLVLRQNYNLIQAFINKDNFNNNDLDLHEECYVKIQGELIGNKSVKLLGKEIVVESIEILSKPIEELPISWKLEKYPGLDHRLKHRHISLREPQMQLVAEMMSFFEFKTREFAYENGIIEIHSPKILGAPSESGAELFELEYFNKTVYLAQSPQFYKQMAIASGYGKVLEVGPVFRANPSFTSRHDTEYTSLDFEISPISSHYDVMAFEEKWLELMFKYMKQKFEAQTMELFNTKINIPKLPFPKIPFSEVVSILEKNYSIKTPEGEDISSEAERKIAEYVKNEYGHDFLFITEYPFSVRPFYHMKKEGEEHLTKSFDLLYKGLEITTGAQREHRFEILSNQAVEKHLSIELIDFYLNFFKHGIPPHGGIGFGFTRLFKQLFGYANVREVTFLPRDPKRIFP